MNKRFSFCLFIMVIAILETKAQTLTLTATASSYYANPISNAIDGDVSTYWNSYNETHPWYKVTFNKYIAAAVVTITSNQKALNVDLISDITGASITGYYYTMNNTETFYIVDPGAFNNIKFSYSGGDMKIYEIAITEIKLSLFNVNYGYDSGGQMNSRTLVLSVSPSQKAAKAVLDDSQAVVPPVIKPIEDNFSNGKVIVYPNPTKGSLYVELENYNNNVAVEMKLFTVSGQLLSTQHCSSEGATLDIQGQPAGTYMLNISVGNETHKWTIIKE